MEKEIVVSSQKFNQQIDEFIENNMIPQYGSGYEQRYGEENMPALQRLYREYLHQTIYQPEKAEQIFEEFSAAVDALPIVPIKRQRETWYMGMLSDTWVETYIPQTEYEKKEYFEGRRLWINNKWFLFLPSLVVLCEGLAEEPVRVRTGRKGLVKRIQPHITYITHESEKITHPRKTIMHPQRTYADMLNEVASQLTNLPVFTARVKITSDNGIEEYTIKTLDPKQEESGRPLFGQALRDRLTRIKAQNIHDEYVRERTAVEAEIRTRQDQCSEPPEAEPPISRHPPR